MDTVWLQIAANLKKISDKMKLVSFNFPLTLNETNIMDVKSHIKEMHRSLLALAKVDTMKLKEIAIQQLVDKRCDDLLNDISKMIDSILNRKNVPSLWTAFS